MKKILFGISILMFSLPAVVGAGTDAPVITSGPVADPVTFNTDTGSQLVTIEFSATDSGSGVCVRADGCSFPSIARVEDSVYIEEDIVRVSGDAQNGVYQVPLTFAQYSNINQSTYADNDLNIYDKNGNRTRVPISSILDNVGSATDNATPIIVRVNSIIPGAVRSATERVVDVSLDIIDDVSGICADEDSGCNRSAALAVSDPDDILEDLGVSFDIVSFSRESGDKLSGTYSLKYHVPLATPKGSYEVFLEVLDNVGNYTNYDFIASQQLIVGDPLVDTTVDNVVHRFYSANYGSHFYTISAAEANALITNDPNWSYEGQAYEASPQIISEQNPVYRFYSQNYRSHFFTMSESEKDFLIANDPNWSYEGVAYYTYTQPANDRKALYRFYSALYQSHFYTTSESERDSLIAYDQNWIYEGIAWYVNK